MRLSTAFIRNVVQFVARNEIALLIAPATVGGSLNCVFLL
jgi:hypothetical protein